MAMAKEGPLSMEDLLQDAEGEDDYGDGGGGTPHQDPQVFLTPLPSQHPTQQQMPSPHAEAARKRLPSPLSSMRKKKVYAVLRGRKPGVYDTWEEAREQIDGFSGAEFRKFTSVSDAETFLGQDRDHPHPQDHPPQVVAIDVEEPAGSAGTRKRKAESPGPPSPSVYNSIGVEEGETLLKKFGLGREGSNSVGSNPVRESGGGSKRRGGIRLGLNTGVGEPSSLSSMCPPKARDREKGKRAESWVESVPRSPRSAEQKLSPGQERAIKQVLTGRSVFITGGAGVGKSFLVEKVVEALNKRGSKVQICATTGIAAVNIGGQTIHSFAGIPIDKESKESLAEKLYKKRAVRKRWQDIQVLLIDEISMVPADLFDTLDFIAKRCRGTEVNGRALLQKDPMGGLQVVAVGDFFQLPPAESRCNFVFESAAWKKLDFVNVVLKHVWRQSDPTFVNMLNELRLGQVSEGTLHRLLQCDRPLSQTDGILPTMLYPHRRNVDSENKRFFDKLQGQVREYECKDFVNCDRARPYLQQLNKINVPGILETKPRMQVMLRTNMDLKKGLCNGTRGVILGYRPFKAWLQEQNDDTLRMRYPGAFAHLKQWGKKHPHLPFVLFANGVKMTIPPVTWERTFLEGKVSVTRLQVPLIAAWALTIHKCVAPDTLVPTSDGLRYMSEIVRSDISGWSKPQREVKVASREGWERVAGMFKGEEEPSIIVRTRMGFELEGSVRHPVLVMRSDGKEAWKLLPDVEIGDVLIMRRDCGQVQESGPIEVDSFTDSDRVPATHISEDLAWVFGILVGDGSYRDTRDGAVDLTNNDTALLDLFKTICERELGVRVCSYKNRRYFCCQAAREFLFDCGFEYVIAPQKKVPWVVRSSPKKVQRAFLKGLFDADGGVNRTSVHLISASRQLIKEVHLMLFHSDIVGRMVEMPNDHAGAWRVEITGAHSRWFMETIGFVSREKTAKFSSTNVASRATSRGVPKSNMGALPDSDEIARSLQKEHALSKKNGVSQLVSRCVQGKPRLHVFHLPYLITHLNLAESDAGMDLIARNRDGLFYDKVVHTTSGRCMMFDLEVDKQHAFVSNGIVSHNCQGMSLDRVQINLASSFGVGMAYVALSRARSLDGLQLQGFSSKVVRASSQVKEFYEKISTTEEEDEDDEGERGGNDNGSSNGAECSKKGESTTKEKNKEKDKEKDKVKEWSEHLEEHVYEAVKLNLQCALTQAMGSGRYDLEGVADSFRATCDRACRDVLSDLQMKLKGYCPPPEPENATTGPEKQAKAKEPEPARPAEPTRQQQQQTPVITIDEIESDEEDGDDLCTQKY
ncbi:ATP-dependent DNA helicase PIF1 [Chloropicon primus]|uniref:ATP-dependent DNA helicase n=1 Tax=Chloropicon primus TaxID=1764295 RepID=A0A5B8MPW7_9CHLO|nr:ATP-dependent DNA helicase PIF1 [Chloropicon primus]|eukprot:QDZ22718.1 ATP-dependent DNA helicase PIF1 [Chloropicon primus]